MHDLTPAQLQRLTAARFNGPQALYTEAVAMLTERPALPDDLAGLVARLREPWFTNGCAAYQREAANAIEALVADRNKWFEACGAHHVASMKEAQRADIAEARRAASEPNCVVVKPLEWKETADGGCRAGDYRVSPSYGQGPERFMVSRGSNIVGWSDSAAGCKEIAEQNNKVLVLSVVTLRTEAEVRAEAWAAAIEAAVDAADKYLMVRTGIEVEHVCNVKDAIRAIPIEEEQK